MHTIRVKSLVTSYNLQYERAAVLFNMGIVYAKLGTHEMASQPKVACGYFSVRGLHTNLYAHVYTVCSRALQGSLS